jgi:hypothetical protein
VGHGIRIEAKYRDLSTGGGEEVLVSLYIYPLFIEN